MKTQRVPLSLGGMAALLAVALLALAVVRSTVMQAQAATPWGMAAICSVAGQAAGAVDPHQDALASCGFCIAAAHVPLQTVVPPVPSPVSIRWSPTVPPAAAVLRQSPPPLHRARGPPIPSGER